MKTLLIIWALVIVAGVTVFNVINHDINNLVQAQALNCQYPDRTTNPPGGCDNSDPCDGATVKGGSGDCLPTKTVPVQLDSQDNVITEGVK